MEKCISPEGFIQRHLRGHFLCSAYVDSKVTKIVNIQEMQTHKVLNPRAEVCGGEVNVDIAAIEIFKAAGLGGARDDVVSSPSVAASVITTIGEEHMATLGDSLGGYRGLSCHILSRFFVIKLETEVHSRALTRGPSLPANAVTLYSILIRIFLCLLSC